MRPFMAILMSMFLACGNPGTAGESKTPSLPARPLGFASKTARMIIPTSDQSALFKKEVSSLVGRIAVAKGDQTTLPLMATPDQARAVGRLLSSGNDRAVLHWDHAQGIPVFITGLQGRVDVSLAGVTSAERAKRSARSFLSANADLLRVEDTESAFREIALETDHLGFTHLRYQQHFRGLEVWGRDIRVHLTREGVVESFTGRYVPTPVTSLSE